MLNRVQFRDIGGGSLYTVPINPHKIDNIDSDDINIYPTLDGPSVRLKSSFDQRVRKLIWPPYQDNNTTWSAQVTELKSYKGKKKQINLKSIDYENLGWKDIKVINVTVSPAQGGILRYSMVMEYIFL